MTLNEKVFRKMGYEVKYHEEGGMYYLADSTGKQVEVYQGIYFDIASTKEGALVTLPPIETSWEVCAEYLVPFMRGNNYHWYIPAPRRGEPIKFIWVTGRNSEAEIHNDNIALAACKAFMEVEI